MGLLAETMSCPIKGIHYVGNVPTILNVSAHSHMTTHIWCCPLLFGDCGHQTLTKNFGGYHLRSCIRLHIFHTLPQGSNRGGQSSFLCCRSMLHTQWDGFLDLWVSAFMVLKAFRHSVANTCKSYVMFFPLCLTFVSSNFFCISISPALPIQEVQTGPTPEILHGNSLSVKMVLCGDSTTIPETLSPHLALHYLHCDLWKENL